MFSTISVEVELPYHQCGLSRSLVADQLSQTRAATKKRRAVSEANNVNLIESPLRARPTKDETVNAYQFSGGRSLKVPFAGEHGDISVVAVIEKESVERLEMLRFGQHLQSSHRTTHSILA